MSAKVYDKCKAPPLESLQALKIDDWLVSSARACFLHSCNTTVFSIKVGTVMKLLFFYTHNTLVTLVVYTHKIQYPWQLGYMHVWLKFWWRAGGLVLLVDVWLVSLLLHNHQTADRCFETTSIRNHLQQKFAAVI